MAQKKQKKPQRKPHAAKPHGMTLAAEMARQRRIKEACEAAAKDTMVRVRSDIHCQRLLWLCCCAMNDAFGIGAERFMQFAKALQARTDWWQEMCETADEEYANEKLRQQASRISGQEIEYLYEAEMRAAEQRLAEEGVRPDGD